jgi:hypothetical protein
VPAVPRQRIYQSAKWGIGFEPKVAVIRGIDRYSNRESKSEFMYDAGAPPVPVAQN